MQLADLIGRTPSAVGLKLSKLASFDPHLQVRGIKGMKNVGKGDRLVFEEFQNNREAQQATTQKQEYYVEFMAYCSDLRACLDLFYNGSERQKLEILGIVVK
ncbi:MAG: hypothetical protein ACI93S_000563 [Ancylomarina sp.]|jgi:hypothetical protein